MGRFKGLIEVKNTQKYEAKMKEINSFVEKLWTNLSELYKAVNKQDMPYELKDLWEEEKQQNVWAALNKCNFDIRPIKDSVRLVRQRKIIQQQLKQKHQV